MSLCCFEACKVFWSNAYKKKNIIKKGRKFYSLPYKNKLKELVGEETEEEEIIDRPPHRCIVLLDYITTE